MGITLVLNRKKLQEGKKHIHVLTPLSLLKPSQLGFSPVTQLLPPLLQIRASFQTLPHPSTVQCGSGNNPKKCKNLGKLRIFSKYLYVV